MDEQLLSAQIEQLREQLKTVLRKGYSFSSPEVIAISRQIDQMVIMYTRLRSQNSPSSVDRPSIDTQRKT